MKKTPLRRKTRLKPINRERRTKEWARAYGSEERVFFVATCLACAVPICPDFGQNENAHIETGGTSRKADADKVIPLCERHHKAHHAGAETFVARYSIDLELSARETERAWQLYGEETVARAKADGRYARWLAR